MWVCKSFPYVIASCCFDISRGMQYRFSFSYITDSIIVSNNQSLFQLISYVRVQRFHPADNDLDNLERYPDWFKESLYLKKYNGV